MIDTHAHLNLPEFEGKIEGLVSDCKKAGVSGVVLGSSDIKSSRISIELAKKYSGFLFASVGIHPQKTDSKNKDSIEEQLKELELIITPHLSHIVAIGETGLDYSEAPPGEENRSLKDQEKLFLGQIELAKKYHLPLIIHARKAIDKVINILSSISNITLCGTFHCYSGGRKRVSKILSLPGKWYFGFDGNLTYDEGLQNIIKLIPEDRILLETDSPYLAPVPHRGEICTSVFISLIQAKINEILGEDLTHQIEKNTKIIFNL